MLGISAQVSRTQLAARAHSASCAPVRSAYAAGHGTVWTMNTTRALARIIIAAQQLPEPARATALAELWQVRTLSDAGQVEAMRRWRECMRTWGAA
jgi:hypothetical protein